MDRRLKPGCAKQVARGLTILGVFLAYFLPDGVRHSVMILTLIAVAAMLAIRRIAAIGGVRLAWKRFVYSIRWRFILLFFLSLVLAAIATLLLLGLAGLLSSVEPFYSILRALSYSGLAVPAIILAGLLCFVGFYVLLTSRVSRYLDEISLALRTIARGDLDVYVAKRGEDELGELAENVNNMALRLRAVVAEEKKLEEAKNELIAGVSHDLRTPLTSIIGYLELVVQQKYASEAEMRQYANIAHQKALRLQSLINELFEYTRLNHGGQINEWTVISLNDLLQQLVEEWTWQFEQAQMTIRLQLPADNVPVLADGNLLVRVFENLLANGIRYGQQGRYLDLALSVESDQAAVRVASYGELIPRDDWERVFVSFYRVDESRSVRGGGSGLGLAIAKQIVQLHNGSIEVRSTEIDGTVFTVKLPLAST